MLAMKLELLSGEAAVVVTPHDPDLLLLERVARQDRAAFRQLYLKYHSRVYQYVLRLLHQPTLAEEVVNDVMFIVWQKAGAFRGQSRVSTWIMGIAYRKGLKSLKRSRSSQSREYGDAHMEAIADGPHACPEHSLENRQLSEHIKRGLERLSHDHRSVVELTVLGYSYPEIAQIVNCPVNTVKTRMFHARRRLRDHLKATANHVMQVIRP